MHTRFFFRETCVHFTKHGRCISKQSACQCFSAKLSEVYPKKIDYRQRLAEIRMRWCKEHKDLDRFRPSECNTLRPVWWFVFPLVLFDVLEGSLLALI